MLLIFLAILMLCVISGICIKYGFSGYTGRHELVGIFGVLGCVFSAFACVIFAGASFKYLGAEHKANIINREYSTNYTAEEIFWASDVIETIQNIKRNRYEINGNLMKNK